MRQSRPEPGACPLASTKARIVRLWYRSASGMRSCQSRFHVERIFGATYLGSIDDSRQRDLLGGMHTPAFGYSANAGTVRGNQELLHSKEVITHVCSATTSLSSSVERSSSSFLCLNTVAKPFSTSCSDTLLRPSKRSAYRDLHGGEFQHL